MFSTREQSESRRNSTENVFGDRFEPSSVFRDKGVIVPEIVVPDITDKPVETEEGADDENFRTLLEDSQRSALMRHGNLRGKHDIQAAVGLTADLLTNAASGALYGVGEKQASGYSHGISTQNDYSTKTERPELKSKLGALKSNLALKAAHRLDQTLDALDGEKIGKIRNPVNIARVAKDMAVVIDKVTKDSSQEEGIHFHIYRPEMKNLQNYGTVHLNAAPKQTSDGE
jgi:hypothetical protein